jgi:hypothetical protein
LYLAIGTRLDISYAVQQLLQFLDSYSYTHWHAVTHVLRYLKGMRNLHLTLGGSQINLLGFTDSDWANCMDTRRSVSGYALSLGFGVISWNTKKSQPPPVKLNILLASRQQKKVSGSKLFLLESTCRSLALQQSYVTIIVMEKEKEKD